MTTTLSATQARRIALAAQGFSGRRVAPTRTAIERVVRRLRVLQLDSVNVFERSHYLPVFSRLGPYDKTKLDALTGREPVLTESWAHEATLIPIPDWPLFEFRRSAMKQRYGQQAVYRDNAELRAWLLRQLRERGPLRASEIDHHLNRRTGPWWGLSTVKTLLEYQFLFGEIATCGRIGFERRYGLLHQVLPEEVRQGVAAAEALPELVRRAAIAYGVATADDLADYFRLPTKLVRPVIAELEAAGELIPVVVQGWQRNGKPLPAWLHRDAASPARVDRDALLSPFDPVVWYRPRAERLFGFHYRIEIYTPSVKRRFGYYCLPILLGDTVAGRIDLKNDRVAKVLRVQSAWLEPGAAPDAAASVASLVRSAAAWQGCEEILVQDWGNLAPGLAAELGRRLSPRSG